MTTDFDGELATQNFNPRRGEPCPCGSGKRFKHCCGLATMDREPPHGVIVRRGWLDPALCDEWVDYFEQQKRSWLTVRDQATGAEIIDRIRVTEKVELAERTDAVIKLLRTAYIQVAEPSMGCTIDWFWSPTVLRYSPGGHYGAHVDSQNFDAPTQRWKKVVDRDVSLLLYLSDQFEGGRLHFTHFNYRYQPQKGDLVLFPSDNRYRHCAEAVTAGTRYAIVSWATAMGSTRVDGGKPANSVAVRAIDG